MDYVCSSGATVIVSVFGGRDENGQVWVNLFFLSSPNEYLAKPRFIYILRAVDYLSVYH